ncbi:MAG TPA: IucA/IucC family C-terminal-domain containing protein [Candidatus Limnocylindrales bacterium]
MGNDRQSLAAGDVMCQADQVARLAPHLEDGFRQAGPRAATAVATRLAESLWREDIGDARRRFHGRVHAFDRVVLDPVEADPLSLVPHAGLREELASAVTGLSLAYARKAFQDLKTRGSGFADMLGLISGLSPDAAGVPLEQLAVEGHNLHPCGRTRLGWDVLDMLHHDLETEGTQVRFVAVPPKMVIGDLEVLPVHEWQLGHLRRRHAGLFADGTISVLDEVWPALPTGAVRTLLTANGYLKLSLDIQVTSTRRTISLAATRNGPVLSRLIGRLLDERVLLMAETAGGGSTLGSGRELSAIVRTGLDGRLGPAELAVPGSALPAIDPITGRSILAGLVDRSGLGALGFVAAYAGLLLPVVLRLAADHGIGLEAHLQNVVPTFVGGRPHRLGLRDFAGLRIMADRAPQLWPGSVIVTNDRRVMLSKVAYTAFQAHLGEIVLRLTESHGLDEELAWAGVRTVVDETLDGHPDHAFYTAPTMPHKALTRMRLAEAGAGDMYVPVRNPLHG